MANQHLVQKMFQAFNERDDISYRNTDSVSSTISTVSSYKLKKKLSPYIERKNKIEVKSMSVMGFPEKYRYAWNFLHPHYSVSLSPIVKYMVAHRQYDDTEVRIGTEVYYCHMKVLQTYCRKFDELTNERVIQLAPEIVSPHVFTELYAWIIDKKKGIRRQDLVGILKAASFLKMKAMLDYVTSCLADSSIFNEEAAVMFYTESIGLDIPIVHWTMLQRITRFFLTFVASKDFLYMKAVDLMHLIKCNYIGVNCETEVFFAVIKWFSHDPDTRKNFLAEIMENVRFGLMPAVQLTHLKNSSRCHANVSRAINVRGVDQLINDGLSYRSIIECYGSDDYEFMLHLKRAAFVELPYRYWIIDVNCNYHHSLLCKHRNAVSFEMFLNYLDTLQHMDANYYKTYMLLTNDTKIQCCNFFNAIERKMEEDGHAYLSSESTDVISVQSVKTPSDLFSSAAMDGPGFLAQALDNEYASV
ncbi:uncharacterized protein LOC119662512 [Teleopsis dalmanni]|uniref:uncharacterized protein LOC119662512 n=1 Tax=Teleopsis dalmanni TaxID=139649 RepID=UPI000D32A3B2|nr:uncharacterized protein LOC119662512 [Teleopsis dalmanni]